jgi:hypothetical protein
MIVNVPTNQYQYKMKNESNQRHIHLWSDGLQIKLRSKCTVDIQTQTAKIDKNVEINETNMTETQCTPSADDKYQREAERILLELIHLNKLLFLIM